MEKHWKQWQTLFWGLQNHWRRKWQPTPVFLPGESQGQRSLLGAVYGVAQSQTWLMRLSSSSSSSKITADGDCSHEIKRHLLLGRKVITNLDSILKSRDITLPTKVCLVKAMVFPVVMYGWESWTIKKAECRRIDTFELGSPLDCKEIQPVHPKGDQSWVFIGRTDTEAETPIL